MQTITSKSRHYYTILVISIILFYFFVISKIRIENKMMVYQLMMIGLSFLFFCVSINLKKIKWILVAIVIFQCFALWIICEFNYVDIPDDAITYHLAGIKAVRHSDSIYSGLKYVSNSDNLDFSDYGYLIPVIFVYKFFGVATGTILLIYLKILSHTLSCFILYKLVKSILDVESARIVVILFGLNVYVAYFASAGLKEPFFELATISATYFTYKQLRKPSIFNFFLFFMFSLWTSMYRAVFLLYYCMSYFIFYFFRKKIEKYMLIYVIGIFIFIYFGGDLIARFWPEAVGLIQQRHDLYDSIGPIYLFLNIINAFISPYPAISVNNMTVNLLTSTYAYMNMGFSLFAFMGIFCAIKNKITNLYPLLVIFLFNCLLVIISGFSMNARFTYPMIPLYYVFIPVGLRYMYQKKIYIPYLFFIFAIAYIYNLRT